MSVDTSLFYPQTKTVEKKGDVKLNDQDQVELYLPGYHTQEILSVTLDVEGGSNPSPATDWYGKLLDLIRIKADNSPQFLNLSDGRFLYYLDYFMAHGSIYMPSLPGAGERKNVTFRLPIHYGDYYTRRYDVPKEEEVPPSGVIATRGLQNLMITLGFGDETDLGNDYTIHGGSWQIRTSYLLLQPDVSELAAFGPAFWQPLWKVTQERGITTTYPDLSYKANFLDGFYIPDCIIFAAREEAGELVLHDDVITDIRLEDKKGNELYSANWDELRTENAQDFELPQEVSGCVFVDLRDQLGAGFEGVFVPNAGDVKWRFTVENVSGTNPGRIIIFHRAHEVAESRADVVGKAPAV